MKVVLDTNILWVSIPRTSSSNWSIEDLFAQRYILCITTDILEEYEEIIKRFLGIQTAQNFMALLGTLPNIEKITKHIRRQLISDDPGDDKFADCYLWGNAQHLVTHDKHFNVLKKRAFPKINVVTISDFKKIMNE